MVNHNSDSVVCCCSRRLYLHAGDEASHCPVNDDSYLKDKVEELDQKVEGIINQTHGNYRRICKRGLCNIGTCANTHIIQKKFQA